MAITEKFPIDNKDLEKDLLELSGTVEELKGATIHDTEVNQDGDVTLFLGDGRVVEFSMLDPENVRAYPFTIKTSEEYKKEQHKGN